uniref:Putative ionotropic receptor ligand binding domain-containing protein n=1 Tax=Stomoxys calcitrans TaxID=35570 RepID=A0A454A0P5_STOCA
MNLTNFLNYNENKVKETQINGDAMNEVVVQSLSYVIEEFFMQMASSFMIIVSCRRKRSFYFFLNLLEQLFTMVNDMKVQIEFVDYHKMQNIEGLRIHNLLLVDSYEAF